MEGSTDNVAVLLSVMKRPCQRAGVRPQRTCASMDHCTTRSLVVSLIIAIAVINPTSGFTIRKQDTVLDSQHDMDAVESAPLEVKYDINGTRLNVVNEKGLKSEVIAIENTTNLRNENGMHDNDSSVTTKLPIFNETTSNKTNETTVNATETASTTSSITSTESSTSRYSTSATSTSQTTTKEPDISETSTLYSTNNLKGVTIKSEEHTMRREYSKLSEIQQDESREKGETGITDVPYNNVLNLNYNKTKKSFDQPITRTTDNTPRKEELTSTTINNATTHQNNSVFWYDIKENGTANNSSTNKTDVKTEKTPVRTTTLSAMTEVETSSEYFNTATEDFSTPVSYPAWKKYTTIDRKRTSTEDTTIVDKDMTKAESIQTRVSLDKALGYTPIPSIEKLKNDFISSQQPSTDKMESSSVFDTNSSTLVFSEWEVSTSTPMMTPVSESNTTKAEMISRRAGFIDNTETTTLKPGEATTSEFPMKINDTEMFGAMYETEPADIEMADIKNVTGFESQSQLVEDAIKEELLKEETMNDNEENAKRHRDERVVPMNDANTTATTATEDDVLSVKPISSDKKINSSLYAVNPNYKPLKKIDVQPPKPFIRDPDDNSWRNESINSLGIVFKPKNASKSFTEVLKNKTESVLSSIGSEKDSKGEVEDLRVRLEKQAEVRKKKKKINKFGDTVYSDYEESAENSTSEDVTSPMSPLQTLVSSTTPSSLPTTPDFELTVNAIPKDKIGLFDKERTTPLVPKKLKKFNNVEYYDTTDEYDADYINLPKMDLKKFTEPLKIKTSITESPDLLFTRPMIEYTSERKGTVQYFPPTQKVTQKVNINDYDAEFNRKVNLYTFKEPPKNVLSVVNPTENYKPLKITEKPTYAPRKLDNMDKNLYLTHKSQPDVPDKYSEGDGNFNRASYVIKHYRDFINEAAAKESEDEKYQDPINYTESPIRGVTMNEIIKLPIVDGEEDYDYELKFRKDVMNRFVDNFNQNSERFKVDFPVLYNSSVVHRKVPETGKVASSSAFMKRLYETPSQRQGPALPYRKPCEPHCENLTVELSPAYELHYYVPEQEEKEEIEPRTITVPYRYRL